jgi:membrane protein
LTAWEERSSPDSVRSTARRGSSDHASGRDASTPSEIPPKGWVQIARRTFQQINEHRVTTEAGAVTFFVLLALFPALAALVSIYGLLADSKTISDNVNAVSGFVPGGGMQVINDQLTSLTSNSNKALGFGAFVGLAVALWSANGAIKSLFDALNVVYGEKEKRGFFRRTLITLGFTLCGLIFIVLMMSGVVALPTILNAVGLQGTSKFLLKILRWPVLFLLLSTALAAIYRYGPSRREPRWRWVSWGGVAATLVWLAVSWAFSFYVDHFGSYNKTYGSLGAVIGFMTWIWISSIVVLAGAELNAEMEHQTAKDSTRGKDKPMGTRQARMADETAS